MRMYKRIPIALTIALLFSSVPSSAQAIYVFTKFSFSGSGYGHGVGMSQIGARAMALAGESATAILNYYYTGTSVETTTDTQILRINIGHLLTSAKIKSDSAGATFNLYAGDISETGSATSILNCSWAGIHLEMERNSISRRPTSNSFGYDKWSCK